MSFSGNEFELRSAGVSPAAVGVPPTARSDGETPSEWVRSARRYYRFTHYVNITRQGAVRVAESPEQLVESIGRYLDDPSLDREGRRRIVLEQCQFLDGHAADRVAAVVSEELADVCGIALKASPPTARASVGR